jgi:Bifunctional DNA primase/polymerase, N-terminal/Family of unknown function (DUF5906)
MLPPPAPVNQFPQPIVPIPVSTASAGMLIPDEILAAAARGWKVFPIVEGTKNRPLVRWGSTEPASNDLDQITRWAMRYPGCNWGCATGKRSGFFGIDLDNADGLLWAAVNNLPMMGYQVKSGKNSVFAAHFYFRQPVGVRIKNSQSKIAPGVDVRGDGGMMVIPPSIHPVSGKPYSIVCAEEVAEAPEWLIDLLKDTTPERPVVNLSGLDPLTLEQIAFGRNIFLKQCREFAALPAGTGVRNAAMNKVGFLAGGLIARDCFDLEFAQGAVLEYAADYIAQDGKREVMRTFQSGLEAGVGSPWVPLEQSPEDAFRADAPLPAGATALTGLPAVGAALGASGGPLPRSAATASYLSLEQQSAHFAGCVYIESMNRALVPDGTILKQDAFSVRYGGFKFPMGPENDKVTDDPWKAWTNNRVYECVSVHGTCFKPLLRPGEIVTRNGQRFVNTYFPVNVERKQGDAWRFLELLAKLLPDQRDREILLAYMAACVQHQGVKFPWAPLLQGVEGNGKTLVSRCVEQAVGERYTHWPKAKELGNKFNDWMMGKVFFPVEDIYVPDAKNEILEDLKPMITGERHEIQKKGVDQFTADICGNFMFNSNHRDAIRVTDNSRRFCILFTAQQSVEDLARDGMAGDYFPNLYKWLREGGYAIVNELLHAYAIPAEFNPAGDCQRAPITSTSREAIAASLGGVEQDIQEAIGEGMQGFCGGWISDHFVKLLPRALRLTPRKRHEILDQMGYVLHPHLKDGRVNNLVLPDGRRSKLYIHRTNVMLAQIASPPAIAKNYEETNKLAANLPFPLRGEAFTPNL